MQLENTGEAWKRSILQIMASNLHVLSVQVLRLLEATTVGAKSNTN